jgi:acetyl-CoA carboxylase biotin carboxyl carrier protein
MDLIEIQNLIKFVSKAGVTEVEIEQKDFKITIKAEPMAKRGKGQMALPEIPMVHQVQVPIQSMPPVAVAPVAAAQEAAPAADENSNLIEVKSPMIGTFYRSSSPDKPSFFEVGEMIKTGDTVCIIEAMKLFNEIESEVTGKIVKFLVDDSTPVEYDQPLFLVDPS